MKILVPVAHSCVSVRLSFALLTWALTTIVPALAQNVMTQTQLAETGVTATRIERLLQDALLTTSLITRAEIGRTQMPDLPNLLRREIDLEISQNGGSGQVVSAFIRSAESHYTLVLFDEVNQPAFGVFVGVT
ncbi:MAG: TonB-dependent receptor plug domain-containing protein [Rhodoferax sp.]